MKKNVFILLLALTWTVSTHSQTDMKRNEAHLNALTIMALKWVDVSYEYILNEESSAGLAVTYKFSDTRPKLIPDQQYAVSVFYRYYISQQNADGIFGEVFTMLNGGEVEDDVAEGAEQTYTSYSDGAFGVGAGYKFISNRGLVLQGYLGIGRNLFDDNAPAAVFRAGVTIGYRF